MSELKTKLLAGSFEEIEAFKIAYRTYKDNVNHLNEIEKTVIGNLSREGWESAGIYSKEEKTALSEEEALVEKSKELYDIAEEELRSSLSKTLKENGIYPQPKGDYFDKEGIYEKPSEQSFYRELNSMVTELKEQAMLDKPLEVQAPSANALSPELNPVQK